MLIHNKIIISLIKAQLQVSLFINNCKLIQIIAIKLIEKLLQLRCGYSGLFLASEFSSLRTPNQSSATELISIYSTRRGEI